MLDNDNIISANVSEAVKKIPTDEQNNHKTPLCGLVSIATAYNIAT